MGSLKDEPVWTGIASRLLMNTITHPFEYVKVLIQIGHEPIPPKHCYTLFGKPKLALPNVLQYAAHIKRSQGFSGCYQGLVPKFCANTLSAIVFEKTAECIVFEDEPDRNIDDDDLPEPDRRKRYWNDLLRDIASRMVAIIVCHPLDVISVRMMAQFVGGETKYNGVFQSIVEIYRENGISGYFSGIVPRLIAHTATLILVSSSTYFINKYIVHDREMRTYTNPMMSFVASTITYPFLVVSTCMSVNNCGLAAGLPPNMPIYNSWTDCWSHLSSTNQLKRGGNSIWRYYTGPQEIINGRAVAVGNAKFFLSN